MTPVARQSGAGCCVRGFCVLFPFVISYTFFFVFFGGEERDIVTGMDIGNWKFANSVVRYPSTVVVIRGISSQELQKGVATARLFWKQR
jgi:hypothetical protein